MRCGAVRTASADGEVLKQVKWKVKQHSAPKQDYQIVHGRIKYANPVKAGLDRLQERVQSATLTARFGMPRPPAIPREPQFPRKSDERGDPPNNSFSNSVRGSAGCTPAVCGGQRGIQGDCQGPRQGPPEGPAGLTEKETKGDCSGAAISNPTQPPTNGHQTRPPHCLLAVSYTHLTLPTKRIV